MREKKRKCLRIFVLPTNIILFSLSLSLIFFVPFVRLLVSLFFLSCKALMTTSSSVTYRGRSSIPLKQLVSCNKWFFSARLLMCIYICIYIHACTFSYRRAQGTRTYIETEGGSRLYIFFFFFFKRAMHTAGKQAVIQEVSRLHLERSKKRLEKGKRQARQVETVVMLCLDVFDARDSPSLIKRYSITV